MWANANGPKVRPPFLDRFNEQLVPANVRRCRWLVAMPGSSVLLLHHLLGVDNLAGMGVSAAAPRLHRAVPSNSLEAPLNTRHRAFDHGIPPFPCRLADVRASLAHATGRTWGAERDSAAGAAPSGACCSLCWRGAALHRSPSMKMQGMVQQQRSCISHTHAILMRGLLCIAGAGPHSGVG